MPNIQEKKVQDKLITLLLDGNYPLVAADACGIPRSTFIQWMKRGQEEEEGPYFEFFNRVQSSSAQVEIQMVKCLKEAAEENWKANLEFLQRRYPDRWGRLDKTRAQQSNAEKPTETKEDKTKVVG